MSKTSLKGLSALILAFLATSATMNTAFAQASVKIGRVTADTTQSPQFTLTGKKKTFKSTKNWLEIDAVFQVSVAKKPKDGYLPDSLDVEIFALINAGREKKLVKHKGSYANVAVNENQAVAVYLPPREFSRITGKNRPSRSDVIGYAVLISYAGKVVASDIKGMKPEATKAAPEMELLPKSKTPFRDLYYDNYLVDSGS